MSNSTKPKGLEEAFFTDYCIWVFERFVDKLQDVLQYWLTILPELE